MGIMVEDENMRHEMVHNRRNPVPQTDTIFATSKITGPGAVTRTGDAPSGIVTAAPTASAYTTITETIVTTISQPGTTTVSTIERPKLITDAAEYSSILASESALTASTTGSAPAATSSSAHKSDGGKSNLGTLIPAIVAPVAAVLIISFVLFWFFMRRRAKKYEDNQPEFAMKEKPLSRESSTKSGTSSTRELVSTSKAEKPPAITTSEVQRPSIDLFAPVLPSSEIGVARPMTPPTKGGSAPRSRTASMQGSKSNVPNFSGLQPNGNRSRSGSAAQAPAPPGLSFNNSNGRNSPYDNRGPGPRPVLGPGPGPRPGTAPRPPPGSSYGPRNSPPRSNGPPPPRPPPAASLARDFAQRNSPDPRGNSPTNISLKMKHTNRAPPPAALNPPTPTGAFNGASPISQFSPIIKETPMTFNNPTPAQEQQASSSSKIHNSADQDNAQRYRGEPPLAVRTQNLRNSRSGADSPTYENILSGENMRIARLANSSRLGFNSPVNSPRVGSPAPQEPISASARSPELPPPVSRTDGGTKPFASSSLAPLSKRSKSNTTSLSPTLPSSSAIRPERDNDRQSVVSRVSTEDGYEDIEVDDNKSDVSSLDEREKWQLESEIQKKNHAALGMSLANLSHHSGVAGSTTGNTNYRDRDSEGPFVLSRY